MVPSFIYIMTLFLGTLLGMLLIGFRYYKKRYTDIKSKYDEVGGDNLLNSKKEMKSLYKRCNMLEKENDSLRKIKQDKKRRRGYIKEL